MADRTYRRPPPRRRRRRLGGQRQVQPVQAVPPTMPAPTAGRKFGLQPLDSSEITGICRKKIEVGEKVFLDTQAEHWIVWPALLFAPACRNERGDYRITRMVTGALGVLWACGLVWLAWLLWGVFAGWRLNYDVQAPWAVGFLVLSLAWPLWAYAILLRKRFIVTDRRVMMICRRLPFQRKLTHSLPLGKVQSVETSSGLIGDMCGFQTVEVVPNGTSDPLFVCTFFPRGERQDQVLESLGTKTD